MIYKQGLLSNQTALTVSWDKAIETALPISGYKLKMADYGSTDFKTIFDGSNQPNQLQFTQSGLIPGAIYVFIVHAMNFNGLSEQSSNEFTFNACTAPISLPQPFRIDAESATDKLVIGWTQPEDDGGCPITSYEIYRDDSMGSDVNIQVNSVNDPALINNPVLRRATITNFEPNTPHVFYKFKLRAINREGFVDSPYLQILNSGHPLPVDQPLELLARTDSTITVAMPTVADDDRVFSYELQIDNGDSANFTSLGGFTENTKQLKYVVVNLTTGKIYRLRYRVKNYIGWSTFSPNLYVLVASVPSQPASPELVSATDTTITLRLHESLYNGGSVVIAYELWIEDQFGSGFAEDTSYD